MNDIPRIGADTRDQRLNAITFDGFVETVQQLAERGYLEYVGDGTDKLHLTSDGLHALIVLHAHITGSVVRAAEDAIRTHADDADDLEQDALACARVSEFLRRAETGWV